jgi:3'-phosphoadenosine 5'-phosphosulfate sulfotransferase (PAPS reductase)/FAD synthetase
MSKQVVSLSGGKDSTAMLLMMLDHGERIDDVVYFDTCWEFPEMEQHINKLERDTGIKITRLKPPKPFDYYLLEHIITRGKHTGQKGYGFARPHARWCTTIKTNTIDKYINGDVIKCIGIAADEQRRAKSFRYPLIEWGITEKDALQYCYERGYTWGGLYEHKKRVSCWCCPLQSINDLRVLRNIHPELFSRLLEMEKHSCNTFRIDYSIEKLNARFAKEDSQMRLAI